MLSTGTVLQKRYRIKRLLAQGGMGAVYEAEAVHLRNATVAVKETFFNDFSNEKQAKLRDQFEREAATLARLHHPSLPQVKDHFVEGTGQFLVMDFIPGDDLDKLLEQRLMGKGEPFDFWMVMEWAERLLGALIYIHGQHPQVIHRDIKPANVKITPSGDLFLIDFGLAKDATTSRPGVSVGYGTIAYAPIEQLKSTGTDPRSDIYSLGATLYHLVTGKLPANALVREESVVEHLMPDVLRPAHHVNPQIPFAFASVLAKAMALDREQRYPNAIAMQMALRQARQEIEAEFRRLEEERKEKQRQEAERIRREEEERKRLEEEARQGELAEQRRREEAAWRQARLDEIKSREKELAKLKLALEQDEATEWLGERPDVGDQRIYQLPTTPEAPDEKPEKKVAAILPPKPPARTGVGVRLPLAIGGSLVAVALLIYLIVKFSGSVTDNPPVRIGQSQNVASNLGDAFTENVNGARLEMVRVPAGSFTMGSPDSESDRSPDEGPQHNVTVPRFYIGKHEVTQAQWKAVMGNNPSRFQGGDNLPVEQVSWNDAKEFCLKLKQMTGKEYRLPSEAEWEYAARAGTTGAYAGNLDSMAWYSNNSDSKTHPVGQKQPNAFGLFDMHGNVWEWCEDVWHNRYGEQHGNPPADGSAWLSGGDSRYRVLRGGSWFVRSIYCRSAYRGGNEPDTRINYDGFRVVVGARFP
ncbi:MAG: SUMF1/EgtB/PvdO family nonheme iron enzyme [Blastocatellales bacterium]